MKNLMEMWEHTCRTLPEKTAVACENRSYRFAEAQRITACWGTRIRDAFSAAADAKPQPVLVITDRDGESILRCFAVLYSGGFYVPVDPEMPLAKLSHIIDDCRPAVALGAGGQEERLREAGFQGIFLRMTAEDIPSEDLSQRTLPPAERNPEDPAYMIYTSGSTGRPKGVLKSHGSVIYFIQTFAEHFRLGAEEIIGNQTPFFFDASAKDIYLMAYTGATLEVIPPERFVMPVTLIEYLNEKKISYICWVPTALALVTQLRTFEIVKPNTLKKVFFVGEVFPLKQLRKWFETLPEIEYVNLYGSTELAGICCSHTVTAESLSGDTLPIGTPLPGTEVCLIADGAVTRTPGVTGEICIASPALALSYYGDPVKTAQTFVVRPDEKGNPVRMLRSGDLAAYDESGQLHFVSRSDYQIKHMGRRIELGEIETGAEKLPEMVRCCCLYNSEKKKIVLFAQLQPGVARTGKEIRSALKQHLSDYMIPSKVVIMDALPLNANGKIDRQTLRGLL